MPEQWERSMGPRRQLHEDIYRMERGVDVAEAVSVYARPESCDGKRERGAKGRNAGGGVEEYDYCEACRGLIRTKSKLCRWCGHDHTEVVERRRVG